MLFVDRKTETNFTVKDFIFGHEPSVWNFDIGGKFDDPHIIDVTDDSSGDPHIVAKSNICLYVNEIGHSKDLHQNVVAKELESSVHYYLKVFKPLRKGESTELLVDYLEGYERSRERKGYGRANLSRKIGGDDDECCLYDRNISERKEMKELISSLTEVQLSHTLYFMIDRIQIPINRSIDEFTSEMLSNIVKESNINVRQSRQWVARCRIEWIIDMIRIRVGQLEKNKTSNKFIVANLIKYLDKEFPSSGWSTPFSLLNDAHNNGNLLNLIKSEKSEEVLYQCSNLLMRPFDRSIWCEISQDLLRQTVNAVVKWKMGDRNRFCGGRKDLVKILFLQASTAAEKIREICNDGNPVEITKSSLELSFRSSYLSRNFIDNLMQKNESAMFSEQGTPIMKYDIFNTPAHLSAAMAAYMAYDKTAEEDKSIQYFVNEHQENAIIMVKKNKRNELLSIPKRQSGRVSLCDKGSKIDVGWYLLWQVVPIVHAVASECVKWHDEDVPDDAIYSLKMLCDVVGVNVDDGQEVMLNILLSVEKYEELRRNYVNAHSVHDVDQLVEKHTNQSHHEPPKEYVPPHNNRNDESKIHDSEGNEFSEVQHRAPTNTLFHNVVWCVLSKLGWRLETGKRPRDYYYVPPGITRNSGNKFKPRVDFFDSATRVLQFIATNDRWKTRKEVVQCLKTFQEQVDSMSSALPTR